MIARVPAWGPRARNVEVQHSDGSMLALDTIQVENTVPANRYEKRMLDYLIYNAPLEYVEPVLSGEIEGYLREYTDYQSSMES